MAATVATLDLVGREKPSLVQKTGAQGALIAAALTPLAVAIHGYHPYAEDGGVYLSGIKRVLDPDLYPAWSGFVTVHLRFSLFAPLVAALVRITHLSLMTVMGLLYLVGIWMTLFGAWQIACRCYAATTARVGAVWFFCLLLTVPVAGTSLMLMDPYVSARSFSTPLVLLAMDAVMEVTHALRRGEGPWRRVAACFGWLAVAALLHPLMAAYGLACMVTMMAASVSDRRVRTACLGALAGLGVCAGLCLFWLSPENPPGYASVAQSRGYWFLSCWHWYEIAGLAAPLMVLWWAGRRGPEENRGERALVAEMALAAGVTAFVVALLFAHPHSSHYLVAKLQPLRIFQFLYALTLVVVGAQVGEQVLGRARWRWVLGTLFAGGALFAAQRATFPNSGHVEWPGRASRNGWEQAFVWIRNHTAKDAVVALDAHYIDARGEDAQNFRAIAERSAIPDYSKDGGVAAIAPDLTQEWTEGQAINDGLDRLSDAQREARLRRWDVQWVVMAGQTPTRWKCDYANRLAKVCEVPRK